MVVVRGVCPGTASKGQKSLARLRRSGAIARLNLRFRGGILQILSADVSMANSKFMSIPCLVAILVGSVGGAS
jgi:hypothetical protein